MTATTKADRCIVIGAGLTGLMAARMLREAGLSPLILEKSRGLGGRCATRRIDDAVFDHGAQFLTVRDPRFRRLVTDWESAGVVREWCRGFPADAGPRLCDGHTRYKAVGGMTALAKFLARDLEVWLETCAASLGESKRGWQVRTTEGKTFEGDSLLITAPVPQALEILDTCDRKPNPETRATLSRIEYDPCLTVLLVLTHAPDIPEPGGVRFSDGPVAFIADNHRKGLSPHTASITIQTSPEFSRDHWESDDETVLRLITPHVRQWIDPGNIKVSQVKRWRYSVPLEVYPQPCLEVFSKPTLILAGDGFGGPRIEGAVLSGLAAAEKLLGSPVTSSE